MADTVDRAASRSPANEAEEPTGDIPTGEAEEPKDAAPAVGAEEPKDAPEDHAEPPFEAEEPKDAASAAEAKEQGDAPEDHAERRDGAKGKEPEDAHSLTELLEQLGGELSDLGRSEAQLEAARNMPEVRRSARDIVGMLAAVVAALSAFAFLNVAAVVGLSKVLANWLAALVLAAVWMGVGGVLLFGLMGRARRWLMWIVLKAPPPKALEELERERDAAGRAARSTLERLGPELAMQIALAAVPNAGDVAGDVASGVASGTVDAADSVLDASDEIVGEFTEQLRGGGAVNQVWAVVLMPGRFGVKVATTVLRRGRPKD